MFNTVMMTVVMLIALIIPAPADSAHKDLTWADNLTDCISGQPIAASEIGGTHIFYRQTTAPDVPESWTEIDAGRANAFTVTGLAPDTDYTFKLRNYAPGGQYCEGLFSAEVTGRSVADMPAPPNNVVFQ